MLHTIIFFIIVTLTSPWINADINCDFIFSQYDSPGSAWYLWTPRHISLRIYRGLWLRPYAGDSHPAAKLARIFNTRAGSHKKSHYSCVLGFLQYFSQFHSSALLAFDLDKRFYFCQTPRPARPRRVFVAGRWQSGRYTVKTLTLCSRNDTQVVLLNLDFTAQGGLGTCQDPYIHSRIHITLRNFE